MAGSGSAPVGTREAADLEGELSQRYLREGEAAWRERLLEVANHIHAASFRGFERSIPGRAVAPQEVPAAHREPGVALQLRWREHLPRVCPVFELEGEHEARPVRYRRMVRRVRLGNTCA